MTVIKPIKIIEVDHYKSFCEVFDIKTTKVAGINETDEELITEELNKIKNQNWIVNFIDNRKDGFFQLLCHNILLWG